MSKKQFKDVFAPEEGVVPASVQNVDKTASGAVTVESDVVIVNGSASKSALYGNGEAFTAVGYAGSGSVKSVAGLQIGKGTDASAVTVGNNLSAKVVAGAKYEFSKEEAKNPLTGFESTVEIAETDVTVLDAKVTDAFAGAVMTDTATSKKFTDKYSVVVDEADIKVVGGTVTNVYGGGTGALSYVKDANIYISGGKVTNVYAGGLDGAVVGDANIYVDLNSGAAASAMSIGTIYAGGKNANLFGDVVVTVTTNGAVGSNGKINKIVGTPAGKGVVYGTRELYLDAYQGDFTASVVAMDKVVIASDSAVTFTKAQDKSMKNAEYVLEVSEADNSNQAAILTLKSAYNINKLTVAVADNLITEGGSFSRTLIAGVKGKFNSTTFDADKVNVAKDNGNLIADYQYDLSFETVTDAKGKEVETGKLIFTYTGADLKVSVDGYTNRYGVANVLSSADDVVTFVKKVDLMGGTAAAGTITDRVIDFDFKTMGGDDEVVIEDDVFFTGKLALGAGNDTVTINGTLSYLDLTGENTVIVNGMLDARGIKTDADSKNTFVLNGSFQSTVIGTDTTLGTTIKQTFYYEDGSWTEDGVDKKKKLVYAETSVTDINGYVTVTKTPFIGNANDNVEVDRWIESLTQTPINGAVQNLTLTKGDNTVVVENALGVGDITLAGKAATVVLNDDGYDGEIDLRSAATSTLVVDADMDEINFTGSRIGESNIVIAKSNTNAYDIADLDLKYDKANLKIEDAVTLSVDDWSEAGLSIEEVEFGYNAKLDVAGDVYVGDFSGYWETAGNLTVLGKLEASEIEFYGAEISVKESIGSNILIKNAGVEAEFGTIVDSNIIAEGTVDSFVVDGEIANSMIVFEDDATVTLDGATVAADSAIVIENDDFYRTLDLTFYNAVTFSGTLDIGHGTANLVLQDASVTFDGEVIDTEFVDDIGTEKGEINIRLVESSLVVNSVLDVNDITVVGFGNITGEGKLNVTGDVELEGVDFTFGADQSINILEADQVTVSDSKIAVAEGYTLTATDVTFTDSVVSGNAIVADDIDFDGGEVDLKSLKADTVSFVNGVEAKVAAIEAAVDVDASELANANITGTLDAVNAELSAVKVSGHAAVDGGSVADSTFGSLNANGDAELKNVAVTGNAELDDVEVEGTFAADKVTLTAALDLNDKASFTANEVVADGNTINVGKDVAMKVGLFKDNVAFAGDKLTVTGLKVDGELDLTALDALKGDVRVYGYVDDTDPNPYNWVANQIKVGNISLDGNFEADITADYDAEIVLSGDTVIERKNDHLFNSKPYGSLNYDGIGDNKLSVMDGEDYVQAVDGKYATIEKGVNAAGNLNVLGNVAADFDVAATLTLGAGAEYEDYVTVEDDATAAVNANIKGDVEAADVVVAGAEAAATVTGDVSADSVTVLKGGALTVTGTTTATNALTLDVETFDKTAPDYVQQKLQAGAVATFNGDVTAAIVTLGNNIAANEIAGAKLDINGKLTTSEVNVGVEGEMSVDAMVIDSGDLTVAKDASFAAAGQVTQSGTSEFDAAEGATIALQNVTFENLTLDAFVDDVAETVNGSVTVGALTVGTEADGTKFDNAGLNVDSTGVTLGGAITMDAEASNNLSLAKDMTVAGKVDFADGDATNILGITGSAAFNGGLHFENNLAMIFTDALDAEANAYAKFDSDITMAENAEETLTISKTLGSTATVELKNINFGKNDDGDALTNETDYLVINANVKAASVNADNSLDISGIGTLTSTVKVADNLTFDDTVNINGAVSVGKTLTMDDNTITGDVTVGADMVVTGDAAINSDKGLDLSKATLTMMNGELSVKASTFDAEGNFVGYTTVGKINGGEDFKVSVTGTNTINADITATKLTATGDTLNINGIVTGAVDAKELGTLGGLNAVVGGVEFNNLTVVGTSVADFTAYDVKASWLDSTGEYVWIEGAGPVAMGAVKVEGWFGNTLSLASGKIYGTVKMGEGLDSLVLTGNDNHVSNIEFGNSYFNETTPTMDSIYSSSGTAAKVAVDDIKFNQILMFGDNSFADGAVTVDRNTVLAEKVTEVNKQLTAIFAAFDNPGLENGGYTVAEFSSTGFGFKLAGKDCTVTFNKPTDPAAVLSPATITVTVDGIDFNTVKGTDDVNMLGFTTDTNIDGSIDLGAGNDVVAVLANVTLNALEMNNFIAGFQYNTATNTWDVAGTVNAEFANSNVLNFGTGSDAMSVVGDCSFTAAQVLFDTLTVDGGVVGGDAGVIAADMVGNNLVIAKQDETTGSFIGIVGDVNSDVTVKAGNVLAVDGVINGDLTLELDVNYVDDDDDPATKDVPVAEYAFISGDVKAGASLKITNNVAVVNPDKITDVAIGGGLLNGIAGNLVGTQNDEGQNISVIEIISNSKIADPADTTVKELAEMIILGDIVNVKELTTDGDVYVAHNGVSGGNVINVNKIVAKEGALMATGEIKFSDLYIDGDVFAILGVNGSDKADKLTLASSTIEGAVAFGKCEAETTDVVEIVGSTASTITGDLTFDGSLEIVGSGAGELVVKDIIGGATADDVLNIKALAKLNTISDVETIKFSNQVVVNSAITGATAIIGTGDDGIVASNTLVGAAVEFDTAIQFAGKLTGTIAGTGATDVLTLVGAATIKDIDNIETIAMSDDVLAAGAAIMTFSDTAANADTFALDLSAWSADELKALGNGAKVELFANTVDATISSVVGAGWTGTSFVDLTAGVTAEITWDDNKYTLTVTVA